MVANAPTTNGLVKRNGAFSGWGMAARKVEVLLVVIRFDLDTYPRKWKIKFKKIVYL